MSEDAKPRTEVTEETRETLSVLEQDRKPRPEKLAMERSFFDGAHEVRFSERSFRPRHGAPLDEIRAFVDSLEVRRREIEPLPPPVAPVTVQVQPAIPDHYRDPLERVIRGALVKVETVHRIGTGTVVDVEWEAADEGLQRGLYVIDDAGARPFDEVASRIDALPAPPVAQPAAPAPAASTPDPAPPAAQPREAPAKRGRFGLGRKEKKVEAAPPPEQAPREAEKPKRRFGFGKK